MRMAERHVAELIGTFFARGGMLRSVRRAEAVVAWPRVVGPDVARFASARALKDGVLFVDVPDSETAMHMALERPRLIEAYAEALGRREVRDVRFVAGRRGGEGEASAPSQASDTEVPLDEDALRTLLASVAEMGLPEPLERETVRAARAMLAHRARAHALGWTACVHCGALSPGEGACDACRRYRDAPGVQRAAEVLAVDPTVVTEALSEEERSVAVGLASEALEERIRLLLGEVLVAPDRLPELEAATRNRLALRDGVAPSDVLDEDFETYDARVARALGRWRAPGAKEDR